MQLSAQLLFKTNAIFSVF